MTEDVIAAISDASPEDLAKFAVALETRRAEHKAQLMALCEALGIRCEDTNGKKRGRRRADKHADAT